MLGIVAWSGGTGFGVRRGIHFPAQTYERLGAFILRVSGKSAVHGHYWENIHERGAFCDPNGGHRICNAGCRAVGHKRVQEREQTTGTDGNNAEPDGLGVRKKRSVTQNLENDVETKQKKKAFIKYKHVLFEMGRAARSLFLRRLFLRSVHQTG